MGKTIQLAEKTKPFMNLKIIHRKEIIKMNEQNRGLLDEVIKDRLERTLDSNVNTDEAKVAFKEAMEAVDRQTEMSKLDVSREEQKKKQKHAKLETALNVGVKVLEIGVLLVGVPLMNYCFNMKYAKELCHFEKDYTFSTQAGKATSKLFRFGK